MKKLDEFRFPDDLKTMSLKELELLSYGIREFLIDSVSNTGGHLASNLGVVELTIALHKVFDSPKDKIIWDVGHQAYVHKILTGRSEQFHTLRKFQGLSGFPKARESEHDAFDTGHSSISISAAAGIAAARDLQGEDYQVIAVIGDGSLTGRAAYEVLNNIGSSKSKVIVILNDNGMSISPNIGGISQHLGRLRTSKGYLGAKQFVKKRVSTIPSIGAGIAEGLADIKNDLKYTIMNHGGVLFEELGFTYFGPVDGHNLEDLLDVIDRAKKLNEPVLIHVITKKGKGYSHAEKHPDKFHGIGPFDKSTGLAKEQGGEKSFSQLMGHFATEIAEKDDRVVAITAAMSEGTGLDSFKKAFPRRHFDVGIAEAHAVTFAAGLAKSGMKPLVAIYSSFLQRAYDQIVEDICLQNLPVVFAIDRAGCVGSDGETHHGMLDIPYLSQIPNMTVLAPADGNQLKSMMEYAFALDGPCAIRYPRGQADCSNSIMSTDDEKSRSATGSYNNLRLESLEGQGKKISDVIDIWAVGTMVDCGQKVCQILRSRGYCAGLVDVACIKPLDLSLYNRETKLLVTIEDGAIPGGYGSQMAAALTNESTKVLNFAWPDTYVGQGTIDELREQYGLTPEKITERICAEIEGTPGHFISKKRNLFV